MSKRMFLGPLRTSPPLASGFSNREAKPTAGMRRMVNRVSAVCLLAMAPWLSTGCSLFDVQQPCGECGTDVGGNQAGGSDPGGQHVAGSGAGGSQVVGGGCPNGAQTCDGVCVDTQTDPKQCGACGHDCEGGSCAQGQCGAVALTAPTQYGAVTLAVERNQDTGKVYFTMAEAKRIVYAVDKTATLPTAATPVTVSNNAVLALAVPPSLQPEHLSLGDHEQLYRAKLPIDLTPLPITSVPGAAVDVTYGGGPAYAAYYLTDLGVWYDDGKSTIQLASRAGFTTWGKIAVNSSDVVVFSESVGLVHDYPLFQCNNPNSSSLYRTTGAGPAELLVSGRACAVFVDADATHAYWTESDGGTVWRVRLLGGAPESLGAGDNAHPAGIVVDQKHVYWVNTGFYANTGELKRTDLDGQNEVTLLTGLPSPVMLADDDGGRLFFISGALGAPAVYKAIKPAS